MTEQFSYRAFRVFRRSLPLLRIGFLCLPEEDVSFSGAHERPVRLEDVRAGGVEMVAGTQRVCNLMIGTFHVERQEVEFARRGVELGNRVAEMIRVTVTADGRNGVGCEQRNS